MRDWLAALSQLSGFAAPVLGCVLAALALWVAWRALRTSPTALAWPASSEAAAAGARRQDPVRWAALGLRVAALLALAAALAGPLGPPPSSHPTEEGLDLVLVLDGSGSMRALDAVVDGIPRTRLELAREVVARFARHRVAQGDRVGLVVFGEHAFTLCPLTQDGRLLEAALGRVEAGMAGEATALGDALALGVERLVTTRGAETADAATMAGARRAGEVVVLLTDGRSNAGSVPPDVASQLATQLGVRVHTVGIGGEGEVAMATKRGGRALETERHDIDRVTLTAVASRSGGRFFAARSSADLPVVYQAIDQLERVRREAPEPAGTVPEPEPVLALAGVMLGLEILLARVFARRLP
jgi:Ca-activated chloride channel family protein